MTSQLLHQLFGEPFSSLSPGDLPPDSGNIIDVPRFVNLAGGDLHLQPDSPAIDAGLDGGVTVDFEGHARPQGDGFDMGAFEAGVIPPQPTPSPTPNPTPSPTPSPTPNPTPGGDFTVFLPLVVK